MTAMSMPRSDAITSISRKQAAIIKAVMMMIKKASGNLKAGA